MIINSNKERLLTLERRLNDKIIDQTEAVAAVTQIITNVVSGFFESRSPLSVLFFAGPTGVGKTEMAKLTADELGWPLHRFDMSEYSEAHKVATFMGSPPGYVGYDEEGALVKVLKKTPCVVLFDEVEKAHRNATRLFLQLFDEGRFTSSKGDLVEAKHAFFIMTSNLGSELFGSLPFEEIRGKIEHKVKEHFSAEFFGRIHQVVVFRPLTQASVIRIGRNYFTTLVREIEQNAKLAMRFEAPFIDPLIQRHFDLHAGARGIQRRIKEVFTRELSRAYLAGAFTNGDAIELSATPEGISIKKDPRSSLVHLDQRFRDAKELVGKWALNPIHYFNYPIAQLITKVEENRVSLIMPYGSAMTSYTSGWMLPDPTIDAHAFLLNLCLEMSDERKKKRCQELIAQIFGQTGIRTLSLPYPLEDLQQKVSDSRLVKELQDLLGNLVVKVYNPFKFDSEKIDFERKVYAIFSVLGKTPPSPLTFTQKEQNYIFPFQTSQSRL